MWNASIKNWLKVCETKIKRWIYIIFDKILFTIQFHRIAQCGKSRLCVAVSVLLPARSKNSLGNTGTGLSVSPCGQICDSGHSCKGQQLDLELCKLWICQRKCWHKTHMVMDSQEARSLQAFSLFSYGQHWLDCGFSQKRGLWSANVSHLPTTKPNKTVTVNSPAELRTILWNGTIVSYKLSTFK